MNHLANAILGLVAAALLVAVPAGTVATDSPQTTAPSTPSAPLRFGMDAGAVAAQAAQGAKPDYGTFWIGPWTLSSGWGGPDSQLAAMRSAGVTPAIHFYYWGDDISPSCVENGCWSSLHRAQKDRAGWERLGVQLTDHLHAKMGGAPALVFLESEFNKGGIETYEPFDGYLAQMADGIHARYPNAIVVLGFGNWGSVHWGTFDRAAAASDMVGVQGMRGSTRQSQADMYTLYDGLLSGVKTLKAKFPGVPVMLTDIAVSSYPEPGYAAVQAGVLKEVFDNMATLRSHGVQAMVYRSWKDSPTMDTANYYGQAERHWGLAWAANGTMKESGKVWVDGVKAARSGTAPAPPAPAPTTSTAPTATTAPTTAANQAPRAAFSIAAAGLTASLDASASSDPEGAPLTYRWTFGDGASATGRTASHAYAKAGTYAVQLTVSDGKASASASRTVTVSDAYAATFTTQPGANEHWVEVKVSASPAPAKVHVKAGGGAWQPLVLRSWGAWGDDLRIPKGTPVQFAATAADGRTAVTQPAPWLGAATATATPSASAAPSPAAPGTFQPSFSPRAVGNDWWVEAAVSGSGVAKVEAKVGGGSWTVLPKTDWGTHAKSLHAPNGSYVQFRATSPSGATATSPTYVWG